MNQTELADAITELGGKASRTQVYNWETGALPRGKTRRHLALALDVGIEWLLSGEGAGPMAAHGQSPGSLAESARELDGKPFFRPIARDPEFLHARLMQVEEELAHLRHVLEKAGLLPRDEIRGVGGPPLANQDERELESEVQRPQGHRTAGEESKPEKRRRDQP